jgi:type I restriction enzyme S subunit
MASADRSSASAIQRADLPKLPPDWRWVQFADICDRVSVGHVGPTTEFFCARTDGVLLVRSQNVRPGKLEIDSAAAITTEFHKKLKKSKLQAGDILFVRVGANRGDCCVVPAGVGELNCANIVFARPKQQTGFHSYFFQSELGQSLLLSASVGAAQGVINTSSVAGMPVPLPPLPVQRRIASILTAYDDLIENSQRRIRILESMARALYHEWFVHFRFLGLEKVKRVASPLGEIPLGWEVKRIDEALRFDSGRTIKKEERENGDTPVYGANGIIGGTANSPMADRCIIMGKIGSCGALHRSHKPCWVTNNSFLVRPAAIQSLELAWQVLLDVDFRQYIGGAANPYMPINSFGQHEVLIPGESVQSEFEQRVGPLRRLIETLSERTENLHRTRDLLLPRLLSGQLNFTEN